MQLLPNFCRREHLQCLRGIWPGFRNLVDFLSTNGEHGNEGKGVHHD